jgi:predicted acylesterase/phospholipase RssA
VNGTMPNGGQPKGDFQHPEKECDLVMKGGVTSGIVYPPAILELAHTYRFRSIGGASAGAIAAAAAAAAEYGREADEGEKGGFEKLDELREWLGTSDHLLGLFQPSHEARPLFETLLNIMDLKKEFDQGRKHARMALGSLRAQSLWWATHIEPKVQCETPAAWRMGSLIGAAVGIVASIGLSVIAGMVLFLLMSALYWVSAQITANVSSGWTLLLGIALSLVILGCGVAVVRFRQRSRPPAGSRVTDWLGPRGTDLIPGAALLIASHAIFWGIAWRTGHASYGAWLMASLLLCFLLVCWFFWFRLLGWHGWYGAFGWLGGFAASGGDLGRILFKEVSTEEKLFGMCTGSTNPGEPEGEVLTNWLSKQLDYLAGLKQCEGPLTFRHLASKETMRGTGKTITFKLVTTNLSQGQPYIFPLADDQFLVRRTDMEKLFPRDVYCYLKSHADEGQRMKAPKGFMYLPKGEDLPIVVATRLSLSFPLLLCAVPLYTVKASSAAKEGPFELTEADLLVNWFSDGGISSNFPLQLFDAWFPTRPTFGIKLTARPKDSITHDKRINRAFKSYRPHNDSVQSDIEESDVFLPLARMPVYPDWAPIQGLLAFARSLFTTAQNYRDNMQGSLPSYRERIVQIRFSEDEGGLNLKMGQDTIAGIEEKGAKAGKALHDFGMERFPEHQWVRMRVLAAQMEKEIKRMMLSFSELDDRPDDLVWPPSKSEDIPTLSTYIEKHFGNLLKTQGGAMGLSAFYQPADLAESRAIEERLKQFLSFMCAWEKADLHWRMAHRDVKAGLFGMSEPLPSPVLRVTPTV